MNALETAKALAAPVGYLGGRWLADPATYEYGAKIGVKGMAFYYVGRGGAMGDVRGEVVASAMAFFPPDQVRDLWNEGRSILEPAQAVEEFSTCLWNWGRGRIASAANLERTIELLARVVDGADAPGRPLFTGWREVARPGDAPALAAQLLHVLRELRGGSHALAIFANGITPIEAAVLRAELMPAFGDAASMGWSDPPQATDELRARRAVAEEQTDQLMARAYAILSDAERAELVEGVLAVRAASKTG